MEIKKNKIIHGIQFFILGLPLLAYPMIFLASIMGLAGHKTGNESDLLILASSLFLWGTLLYPIFYIFCIISFYVTKNTKKKPFLIIAPYAYIVLCVALFYLRSFLGK